jgi:hypothetical protein
MTYVFTTLDHHGATDTSATGIDGRGGIVGNYVNSSGAEEGYTYTDKLGA